MKLPSLEDFARGVLMTAVTMAVINRVAPLKKIVNG